MSTSGAVATFIARCVVGHDSNLQIMLAYQQYSCCKAVSVFDYAYSVTTVPVCIQILCCDIVQRSPVGPLYEVDNCVKLTATLTASKVLVRFDWLYFIWVLKLDVLSA